jgi:hypothetical protein
MSRLVSVAKQREPAARALAGSASAGAGRRWNDTARAASKKALPTAHTTPTRPYICIRIVDLIVSVLLRAPRARSEMSHGACASVEAGGAAGAGAAGGSGAAKAAAPSPVPPFASLTQADVLLALGIEDKRRAAARVPLQYCQWRALGTHLASAVDSGWSPASSRRRAPAHCPGLFL